MDSIFFSYLKRLAVISMAYTPEALMAYFIYIIHNSKKLCIRTRKMIKYD